MKSVTRAKWLLEGKGCDNCGHQWSCNKNKEELLVCGNWTVSLGFDASQILKIVRVGYPNMIRGELFSEQPMVSPEGIYHIKPKYNALGGTTMGPMVEEEK